MLRFGFVAAVELELGITPLEGPVVVDGTGLMLASALIVKPRELRSVRSLSTACSGATFVGSFTGRLLRAALVELLEAKSWWAVPCRKREIDFEVKREEA